jgi:hypothetical protein
VRSLEHLCPDALQKGCQGLLTMQWRTRDIEEETGYAARFAWDPSLTPEAFYQRMASDAFGADHAGPMAEHLLELQGLDGRWTGVKGTPEIAEMIFAAWDPPAPLELDVDAIRFLLPFAQSACEALGARTKADGAYEGAMFDQLADSAQAESDLDRSQLGVQEFEYVLSRLNDLLAEPDTDRLRAALFDLQEQIYDVRAKLIHRGLTPAEFSAVDLFLMRIHHLVRNVGAESRMAALGRIRTDLAERREQLASEGRIGRLERVDYLAANIDFVVHHDRAALLLAPAGPIAQALEQADAAGVVVSAYETLLGAGMREAVLALTHKLTTRCELGILATVNIKPLAAYREAIERLTACMPAAPPLEVRAKVHGEDVHLWWPLPESDARAQGFHVYRSDGNGAAPIRLTDRPLPTDATLFLDRSAAPGRWRYSVTALAEDGWESPASHPADVSGSAPHVAACQPPSLVEGGQPLEVRVIAVGERPVTKVDLHYRSGAQGRWQVLSMLRRFRRSYQAHIPAEHVGPGLVEFFVVATDDSGQTANWPAAATQGRPWTASVVSSGL